MSQISELIDHLERVEIRVSLKKEVYHAYKLALDAFLPEISIEAATLVGLEELIKTIQTPAIKKAFKARETR